MLGSKQKIHIPLHKYKEFLQKITEKDSVLQSGSKFTFRCPICGDSVDNPLKKSGWLLTSQDGNATMGCLRGKCAYKSSFNNCLKHVYPEIYKEWITDVYFVNGMNEKIVIEDIPKINSYVDYSKFISIREKNPQPYYEMIRKKAIEFVKSRRIPKHIARDFLYCPEYEENKFINRIIMPHYMKDGTYRYFEARDLTGKSFLKYKYPPAVTQEYYNLNFVDKTRPFFIFEGTIDSFFIENSIAAGGASKIKTLLSLIDKKYHKNIIIVFDGDTAGIQSSYKLLRSGYRVFVWNDEMMALRDEDDKIDMNQLLLTGYFDNSLTEESQIRVEEIMKNVMNPTLPNLLQFEVHYSKFGYEMEEKKHDRFVQKRR